jgi:hypothetical protein
MLKKFINKNISNQKPIFPQINHTKVEMVADSQLHHKLAITNTEQLVEALLIDDVFLNNLSESVATIILERLVSQYEFEPADKYREEVANKKKYLNQLDSYLVERKEINQAVEGELSNFLQQTTTHLTSALENFATSIQNRIKIAENTHGIDVIKQSILTASHLDTEVTTNE